MATERLSIADRWRLNARVSHKNPFVPPLRPRTPGAEPHSRRYQSHHRSRRCRRSRRWRRSTSSALESAWVCRHRHRLRPVCYRPHRPQQVCFHRHSDDKPVDCVGQSRLLPVYVPPSASKGDVVLAWHDAAVAWPHAPSDVASTREEANDEGWAVVWPSAP
jgi:hypothetical protein